MAVKGKSKADILAAFRASSRQRRGRRDDDRARRDRPDRGAPAQGHPALSANARVIRGRILSFTGDPAESGSRAHSLIDDGAVLVAGGLIEAVGEARDILERAPPGALVDDHSGCTDHARLHRRAHPLSADPGDRLLRRATARLAPQLHLCRRAEIRRSRALRADRRVLSRRAHPLGHHDRDGLLHGASGVRRRVLRRGAKRGPCA